jgi:hypothetical protein
MHEARTLIASLGLAPHPEGGWYRETWRSPPYSDGRSAGTAIYYLLEAGQRSAWHRVDADETWHFYAGDPLEVGVRHTESVTATVLGIDFDHGQRPQVVVPAHTWQSATPLGAWTLCGCTVSPGFTFSGLEIEEPGR